MTLTEFLLARIAEDEQRVAGISSGEDPDFFWGPDRIRVECEAKRRIVEATRFSDDPRSAVDEWLETAATWDSPYKLRFPREISAMVFTLKTLALPYSEHPDYDTAWNN